MMLHGISSQQPTIPLLEIVAIYIDGSLDTYQHIHAAGLLLGSGTTLMVP